jgi:hypothetical protein
MKNVINGKINPELTIEIDGTVVISKSIDLSQEEIVLPYTLFIWGNLDLRDAKIMTLPIELRVKGDLHLEGTGLTKLNLPENLEVDGNIYF